VAEPVDQTTAATRDARAPKSPTARRALAGVAIGLVIALAVGYLLPEPYSLAAETVVNQPLAEAQAAEATRQAEIQRLLAVVAANPEDRAALSDLADAYLAGATAEDLQAGAQLLLALISLEPDDADPYGRLITAYIRAEDWVNAEAATDALAELDPDSADIPFFRGLIAWQGHRDAEAALAAFDQFLAQAPDDPRVPMIRALRSEAAAD
jgi:tetratricopeptide (TPR) repeat protein